MQHDKFRGRLTAILVIFYLSLFGIPFIEQGGGILPLNRLFDTSIPWNSKWNLKPGIDIKGGISLTYAIQAPPNLANDRLAEQVAESLKKRVDPHGVKNLVWRPQGSTQLEIQMPLGENSEATKIARQEFSKTQNALEATNIRLGDVRAAFDITDPAKRVAALNDLAGGHPARLAVFEKIQKNSQQLQAAIAKEKANPTDAAAVSAKIDAEDAVKAAEREFEATNFSIRSFQANVLDLYQGLIEKAEQRNKKAEVEKLKAERKAKIQEQLDASKTYPRRRAALEQFVAKFEEYSKIKGSLDDAESLKRLLRGSGVLEFHILWEPGVFTTEDDRAAVEMKERILKDGPLPRPNDILRFYEVDQPEEFKADKASIVAWGGKLWALTFITPEKSMIHKEGAKPWGLNHAKQDQDPKSGKGVVAFELDAQGAVLFGELSGAHINKKLAIVLDDKLISAPNLVTRIEGNGQITGNYTQDELDYLIRTLNAGSLPAKLADDPISERIISPSLGQANLRAGLMSCVIGLIVVAIFLIGYYYFAGSVALVAVLLNMLIILGVLSMFNTTFTLPGIAAMVLTLGSAVDANVLIFERLREEEQRGLTLRMSVRNAYDRAFSAILDSNVITIITSVVLYFVGSEDVKGFGLTLLIGIGSSLFTALFVTRAIFDFVLDRYPTVQKFGSLPLSVPAWDRMLHPNVDWIGKAGWFIASSVIILAIGIAAFVKEGRNMFDIEFVGGTQVHFELKEPATQLWVTEQLSKPEFAKDLPSPQVVALGSGAKELEFEVVTPNETAAEVRAALMRALEGKLNIEQQSEFEHVNSPFEAAQTAGAIRPADAKLAEEFSAARSTVMANQGGVAIIVRNLRPALSSAQIADRIERARLQPDRANMPYRKVSVESAEGTALVIVSDDNLPHDADALKWETELARPIWKLVTEAINRPAQLKKVSNFDAQLASSTKNDATSALVISILLVMAYIWLRFGNFKYGSATVVAMLHDVILVAGAIGMSHFLANSWFGRHVLLVEPFRINMTLVAALLTVMSYSMIDTIVVFDRIRENRGKFGFVSRQVINDSINQTLSRTLLTAGTTVVVLFIMYVFGGPSIHGFTFTILVGIIVGTYSSIAVAAPLLLIGGKDVRRTTTKPASRMIANAPETSAKA